MKVKIMHTVELHLSFYWSV